MGTVIGKRAVAMRAGLREEAVDSISIKNFTLEPLEARFFAKLECPVPCKDEANALTMIGPPA